MQTFLEKDAGIGSKITTAIKRLLGKSNKPTTPSSTFGLTSHGRPMKLESSLTKQRTGLRGGDTTADGTMSLDTSYLNKAHNPATETIAFPQPPAPLAESGFSAFAPSGGIPVGAKRPVFSAGAQTALSRTPASLSVLTPDTVKALENTHISPAFRAKLRAQYSPITAEPKVKVDVPSEISMLPPDAQRSLMRTSKATLPEWVENAKVEGAINRVHMPLPPDGTYPDNGWPKITHIG